MDESVLKILSLYILFFFCNLFFSESLPTTPFNNQQNVKSSSFAAYEPSTNTNSCPLQEFQMAENRRSCPSDNKQGLDCPLDDSTVDICCYCFEICCFQLDYESGNINTGIVFPDDALRRSTRSNLQEKVTTGVYREKVHTNGTKESSTSAVTIGDTGTTFNESQTRSTTRMRRATTASKTAKGTGDDAAIEDNDEEDKDKSTITLRRKEFEKTVARAESDYEDSENADVMSTTSKPPPASCSSKSKRCDDEPEPDLLDEFFPPKKGNGHKGESDRGKGKRTRRDLTIELELMPLAKVKLGEIDNYDNILLRNVATTEAADDTAYDDETENPSGNKTEVKTKANKDKPVLVTTSMLSPNVKPGKCELLTAKKSCVSIMPDAKQCSMDSECEGTKKCCIYGCKPYDKIGICSVPTMF